ncbi:1-deoxy-D-xylulose-5-phosphate synthase [Candidatus Woesearchaeota archaeon]|jgi:1-deoxy-D-xylulose-5-phosphate synthase|nr:1-deoxy-D-xylulose-5-phosphate synthase [Candidatus Woesearchaeota archaeon]MDP6648132.1 1-deoxy-D-xylulose-5-phosphate synthase [Candidatus Woesearchaeota archaeon]|tara:strand:- start:86824 stop:88713 length:1890 start_codon:yes stop_codon:yes gene_type:complete
MQQQDHLEKTSFLDKVNFPNDLKKLGKDQLKVLAQEIRGKILNVVSKTGGHLGSPLGAVELTLAVHYIFDAPKDKIIIDTGHQSYPHKLITGRRDNFHTLRQYKGVCGFCNISESEYDVFGAGHAATSISAALGIAKARDYKNEDDKVVVIVGDGALTAGLAFEGLNNLGASKTNMLVILNDNRMSISPNVGAISNYLNKIVLNPKYFQLRKRTRNLLKKIPGIGEQELEKVFKAQERLRNIYSEGIFFESLGFQYFGPIDGHNIDELITALENVKNLKGPVLLHVKTEKGKGYEFAEKDLDKFHGMSPFDPINGQKYVKSTNITYTDAFANALIRIAEEDKKIVAITAAMKAGTGLNKFEKHFPDRTIDVGIAEQHAVTFAAGLAINGMKPVCAIYSTFLQRSFDMIIHDVCLQNLPVIFALDRAGLVGDDGPTHNGPFDIAYFRLVPNITIMVPKDENELQHMLYTATLLQGPSTLRYPRGGGIGVGLDPELRELEIGKAEILEQGSDLLILGVGPILYDAMYAVEELKCNATIVNARFVKPLDEKVILKYANKIKNIITLEEGTINGGFGSAVLELLEDNGIKANVKRIGIPDKFIDHGKPDIQKKLAGIDKESIKKAIVEILKKE